MTTDIKTPILQMKLPSAAVLVRTVPQSTAAAMISRSQSQKTDRRRNHRSGDIPRLITQHFLEVKHYVCRCCAPILVVLAGQVCVRTPDHCSSIGSAVGTSNTIHHHQRPPGHIEEGQIKAVWASLEVLMVEFAATKDEIEHRVSWMIVKYLNLQIVRAHLTHTSKKKLRSHHVDSSSDAAHRKC
nr:hypothetical protein CFP56_60714 [Quercus suber]